MSRKSLWMLCTFLLVFITAISPGSATAASRSVPEQVGKTGLQDTTPGLKGDVAALHQALSESAHVKYKILVIDDTDGEDREAYLDRVLAQWGWPEHDTLLLIVYANANYDVRFAMGADFRQKWNVSVDEMLVYVREIYLNGKRDGDPAKALAEFVGAINRRAKPKLPAFAALNPGTDKPTKPDEVVRAFYQWYIQYSGPTGQPPKASVLGDRAYRTSPYLTADFIGRVDQALAEMDKSGGGVDLFLCAQNPPDDIDLYLTQEEGNRATTTIRTFLGVRPPRHLNVDMVRVDGRWQIDRVRCPKS